MATWFQREGRCDGNGDQVRCDDFHCGGGVSRRGGGKAQLSLERILSVIPSRRVGEALKEVVGRGSSESGGGVDLDSEAVGGDVVCESESAAVVDVIAGGSDGVEAIPQEQSFAVDADKIDNIEVSGRRWLDRDEDGGFLGLLIQAAQLVAGGFEGGDEKDEPSRFSEPVRNSAESGPVGPGLKSPRVKRNSRNGEQEQEQHWMMEDLYGADISPVVKSKRGRTQVLPYRYRDSVIELLRHSSRSQPH